MYSEKEKFLKEALIERKVRQLLYWRRKNHDPDSDYTGIKTLPFEKLPCSAEETADMREYFAEQLEGQESEMPVFKNYCERMHTLGWPKNLVSSILTKNDFSIPFDTEDALENMFEKLTRAESKYIKMILKEGKRWNEVCDVENIYVVELCEQFCSGLKKLRRLFKTGRLTVRR